MSDKVGWAIFYALLLVLPVSALLARRQRLGRTAMMAAAWVGIFAIGLVVVALVNRNEWLVAGVHELFYGRDQSVVGREVRIHVADDGHFYARVTINGVARTMLIDSGATYTGVSADTAAAAGIAVDPSEQPVPMVTANGIIKAQPARIDRLVVGNITARDAPVMVAREFGDTDLLGMSFLSKLQTWRVEGDTLILVPKAA